MIYTGLERDLRTYGAMDQAGSVNASESGGKLRWHLWWLEGIFGRKLNLEKEDTTSIWRTLRAHDGRYPVVDVVS